MKRRLPSALTGMAAVAAVLAVLPGATAAAAVPVAVVTGPAGSNGWYTGAVAVHWEIPAGDVPMSGCADRTLSADTAGIVLTCRVLDGAVQRKGTVTVKIDATPPTVTAKTARPPDHGAWYNHPVPVNVTATDALSGAAACPDATYGGPDGSAATVTAACRDNAGNSGTAMLHIQYDASAPTVSVAPGRPPDSGGWYRKPVSFSAAGTDPVSGVSGCSSGSYGGPDGGGIAVSGTCTDNAGNTGSGSFGLNYDATPPSVTATPDRPPDGAGQYNHAVVVGFAGVDPGSGIAQCSRVTYGGPDAAAAQVEGSCTDRAGNTAGTTFTLAYDATPPPPPSIRYVLATDRAVAVSWTSPKAPDLARLVVTRTPRAGGAAATVYQGGGGAVIDHGVSNGHAYRYVLAAYDRAGNHSEAGFTATPNPHLIAPRSGSRLTAAPTLRWARVRGARYYNVQVFRNHTKVLSTWTRTTRFRLPGTWSYGGSSRNLTSGYYRWFVWPGFGSTKEALFGPSLGSRMFAVVQR